MPLEIVCKTIQSNEHTCNSRKEDSSDKKIKFKTQIRDLHVEFQDPSMHGSKDISGTNKQTDRKTYNRTVK